MPIKNELLTKLSAPFHPSSITWRPGALTKDRTKGLAMAYADLRAYQNRLDEVCGLDWACAYTPWGDRIICHLTINGITRSSTGEADSERGEFSGTAAEAQAFKRACAMFGLGRYLYNMPSLWVEYDEKARGFSEKGKARLQGTIAQHYQRWQAGWPAELEAGEDVGAPGDATVALRTVLDEAGAELYGQEWARVRAHNAQRLGTTDEQLTAEQIQTMITGLKALKAQRQAA